MIATLLASKIFMIYVFFLCLGFLYILPIEYKIKRALGEKRMAELNILTTIRKILLNPFMVFPVFIIFAPLFGLINTILVLLVGFKEMNNLTVQSSLKTSFIEGGVVTLEDLQVLDAAFDTSFSMPVDKSLW